MHANAIANGVVVSFLSKMLTHRKITPAAIKPKLAMMKSLFNIFFISFSPLSKKVVSTLYIQNRLNPSKIKASRVYEPLPPLSLA